MKDRSSFGRPKPSFTLASSVTHTEDETELEDMMADSAIATPPLDPETDSSDDPDEFEHSLRSPISPSPISILHHRPCKNLQERSPLGGSPLDSNRGQEASGHTAAPVLVNYGKGTQIRSRRPTVTFDLDDGSEPFSPPTKLSACFALEANQRTVHFRHDDGENDGCQNSKMDKDDSVDGSSQDTSDDPTGPIESSPDIRDKIQQVEQALCQVSIAPDVVVGGIDDENHLDDNAQERTLGSNGASESSSSQDIILNHVFTGTAPQDMLVALFDRPSELQALAARHSEFFNLMYSSVSKTSRDEFKTLLFKPREILSDRDWMSGITGHLGPLPPCILEKFKGIVGWIGSDYDDEDENVHWGEDEYGCRDSSLEQVQIKWFRDIEDFPLETFQECYPQFFVNAREQLEGRRLSYGGDRRDQYVIFCETLGLSRQDVACDNAWTRRINGCLEKHPELALQLKEIIAYEVEYDY